MPGHKGVGDHLEAFDITEISGADSLYEANGIIAESEKNAGKLFNSITYYSAEGSSLSIRAMIYLCSIYAKTAQKEPLIYAARNVHKSFVSAVAALDVDVEWMSTENADYLSCKLTGEEIGQYLDKAQKKPVAVYVTSPDYLGNIADIESIANECHKRDVLLVVDNAHGAYLQFMETSMHPIALGADMCCDSAHKTLPALTGSGYLHISKNAPAILADNAKRALSLFGSTSPSYLILASLDRLNGYIQNGYSDKIRDFSTELIKLKKKLGSAGYTLIGDEALKLTISAKEYGYTGRQIAEHLEEAGIFPEFADPDYIVLMLTPENGEAGILRLEKALLELPKKAPLAKSPLKFIIPNRAMSIREAVLSASTTLPVEKSLGKTLASITVGCPPAVPIIVCGEVIDENTIECFKYYGIDSCTVVE